MPIPGDVRARQPLPGVTSVDVVDCGPGKTPTLPLRIISEVDRSVWEVTHLAVWPGMPRERTLRAKRCPAGATRRRGHQLALDLLQARYKSGVQ